MTFKCLIVVSHSLRLENASDRICTSAVGYSMGDTPTDAYLTAFLKCSHVFVPLLVTHS